VAVFSYLWKLYLPALHHSIFHSLCFKSQNSIMKHSIFLTVYFLATAASAMLAKPVPPRLQMPASFAALSTTGNSTFQQLLNHSDPSLGTFSQTYWYSFEFWKGPGSPVSFCWQTCMDLIYLSLGRSFHTWRDCCH